MHLMHLSPQLTACHRPARCARPRPGGIAAIFVFSMLGFALPIAAQPAKPPSGVPASGDTIQLGVFTVSGEKDEGYRSNQTTSGSRTVEELKDIANSISIYNRDLIDDLQATTIAELSQYFIAGERTPDPRSDETVIFRGITNGWQLHDGIIWYPPVDTFNIERVEVLRGPNAFLYGEAGITGSLNQLTKRAVTTHNFDRLRVTYGSDELKRAELDVNRRLNRQLAVRANVVVQDSNSFVDHAYRKFVGGAFAVRYQPFAKTTIDAAMEIGRTDENRPIGLYSERFTTTLLNGSTGTIANTRGGFTLFPALGKIFNMTGTRLSTGNFVLLPDESLVPRQLNFVGPNGYQRGRSRGINASLLQRVGDRLSLQLTLNWQDDKQWRDTIDGDGANSIYIDRNTTLPDGTTNPYLNQYYTEYFYQRRDRSHIVRDARIAAVYDWKLPFMSQRLIATAMQHQDNPNQFLLKEFVTPGTASFTGTLLNANTLTASSANSTTLSRNYFYRRFYLKDGDAPNLTAWAPVVGRSTVLYDGGTAGRTTDRRFYTPSYGAGASGSYLDGRVRTMLGWRHDQFISHVDRAFANPVTNEQFELPERPREYDKANVSAANFGAVWHLTDWVAPSFNYAQAFSLTTGEGVDTYKIGSNQGVPMGDGYEAGLRWSLLGGRLESNWTYYVTNSSHARGAPAPPATVRTELGAIFSDFNTSPAASDTQTLRSSGLEFETVANLTQSWKLIWNYATNRVKTSDTLPELRAFKDRARAQNAATPNLDSFLATVIDGTPIRGYTKVRSNLVTSYRIRGESWLKGVSIGGGAQYRDQTFLGNADVNRDGIAEMIYAPGFLVWNLSLGYSRKVYEHNTNYTLGVNNLFDKNYYRASHLNGGAWSPGRQFRFTASADF